MTSLSSQRLIASGPQNSRRASFTGASGGWEPNTIGYSSRRAGAGCPVATGAPTTGGRNCPRAIASTDRAVTAATRRLIAPAARDHPARAPQAKLCGALRTEKPAGNRREQITRVELRLFKLSGDPLAREPPAHENGRDEKHDEDVLCRPRRVRPQLSGQQPSRR
jgi:hypothetical protein